MTIMNHQQQATSISREARPSKNELTINLSIFRDLPPLDSNGMPITTGPPVVSLPFRPRATHMITQSRSDGSNYRHSATTASTSTSRFVGFNSNSNCDRVATRSAFSPSTRDDMIEREQLWKLQPTAAAATVDSHMASQAQQEEQREPSTTTIDFAPNLAINTSDDVGNEETSGAVAAAAAQVTMDCDDFSVSSREADSLLSEQDLENISKDPVSFWEGSIDTIFDYRSASPDQHSMEISDNDQETSFLPSPTSVTAIASIVGLSHK
jgi:hypothetical protein